MDDALYDRATRYPYAPFRDMPAAPRTASEFNFASVDADTKSWTVKVSLCPLQLQPPAVTFTVTAPTQANGLPPGFSLGRAPRKPMAKTDVVDKMYEVDCGPKAGVATAVASACRRCCIVRFCC